MGQQQLLLLVLGIVIVGIAVVAGIQAFSEGKAKAEQDAAISDAMRIISDVQAWKLKPTAFGGGDNGVEADFAPNNNPVSFAALGINDTDTNGKYVTLNGCYTLTGASTGATILIERKNGADCGGEIATVTVNGTKTSNIAWQYAGGTEPDNTEG